MNERLDELTRAIERIPDLKLAEALRRLLESEHEKVSNVLEKVDSRVSMMGNPTDSRVTDITWGAVIEEFGPRLGHIVFDGDRFVRRP